MLTMLNQILEKLEGVNVDNTFLYFITRVLKEDAKKTSKVLNKYNFRAYQIDVNDEIRGHLYGLTEKQLSILLKKKISPVEYDVINDETDQLLTYSMTNKAMSFADVVDNQLSKKLPKIHSLQEIIAKEELWAYCVGFYCKDNSWIYTFRKILSGKIAIDEKNGSKKGLLSILTHFNSRSQKLELIKGETINLDKQVDCIYYNGMFYISKKTQFEQIVGLEEEYKQKAIEVSCYLKDTEMIEGLEFIDNQIESNPVIHKKLVRFSKIDNFRKIDKTKIQKMQEVCDQHGDKLKVNDKGKLLIENDDDIDLVLKMLADYYKRGEVSGKAYGTFAGKQLPEIS